MSDGVQRVRIAVALALAFIAGAANASISLIAIGADDEANAQTIECTAPTSTPDGSLLGLWVYVADNVDITVNETGWTEQVEAASSAAGDNAHLVATKIASSESGNYTVNIAGGLDRVIMCTMASFGSVDTGTPMDAAGTSATELNNDDTPTSPSITTVTNNAWVVTSCSAFGSTSGTKTIPVGYTEVNTVPATNHHLGVAYKSVSAGLEAPGDWGAFGTGADSTCSTIALRPAAAGGAVLPILINQQRSRRQ